MSALRLRLKNQSTTWASPTRMAGLVSATTPYLEGKKEKATHENTCCEGQGTRLLGSLPEHIYSIAPDGLYVHLYEPSTIRWQQGGQPMELVVNTRFPFETAVHGSVKTTIPTLANLPDTGTFLGGQGDGNIGQWQACG